MGDPTAEEGSEEALMRALVLTRSTGEFAQPCEAPVWVF